MGLVLIKEEIMKDLKEVYLRCNDHAETVQFIKYEWKDNTTDFEFNIMDSYCGYDFMGIKNRFKRAWRAFWAKPICYTGVFCEGEERVRKFLTDCLNTMDDKNQD